MTSSFDVANSVYPVTMTTMHCCSILDFGIVTGIGISVATSDVFGEISDV